jgi:hypothetical protein
MPLAIEITPHGVTTRKGIALRAAPDMISSLPDVVLAIRVGIRKTVGPENAVASDREAVEWVNVAIARAGRLVACFWNIATDIVADRDTLLRARVGDAIRAHPDRNQAKEREELELHGVCVTHGNRYLKF